VPGGDSNSAAGQYSFAAGKRAKANHDGAFVWGDSTLADVASTAANQFIVRASGGVWFGTTSTPGTDLTAGRFLATSTGAYLTTGGTWTNSSDRARKENVAAVDGSSLLEKLAALPVQTWNYTAEDASVRHMGPMAQDFYAAFGLGEDDKHIATVDADGVALAAIQALYGMLQQKETEIARQAAQLADQREENAQLKTRLGRLESLLEQRLGVEGSQKR
jgi:trimeric autotransporter adhesin